MRIGRKLTTDEKTSNAVCAYLLLDSANAILSPVLHLSGASLRIARVGLSGVVFGIFLLSILAQPKRNRNKFIVWEGIAFVIYGWSVLIGADFSYISEWLSKTILFLVPMMILAYVVEDYSVLYKKMTIVIYPILLLNFVKMFGVEGDMYDMHFSYNMVFVIIIVLAELLKSEKNKKAYRIFLAIIFFTSIICLISYGSRGSLVCIVFYLLTKTVMNNYPLKKKIKYILIILVVSFAVLGLLQHPDILLNAIQRLGFKGRSLALLLNGNFFAHRSGRDEFWNAALDAISKKPIMGWGIGGAAKECGFIYPHQMFLDLLLAFGIPIGAGVSITVVWNIIKKSFAKDIYYRELLLVLVCTGFICLQFSSTLFINQYWFLLMGLLAKKRITHIRK